MWPFKKRDATNRKCIDSETLAEVPGRIPFNLFHRPKEIVGPAVSVANNTRTTQTGRPCPNRRNRPKVNLFPQISLTDVSDKDLDHVVNYMYSSDWKEASAYCAQAASCINLGEGYRTAAPAVGGNGTADTFSDRYRKRSGKAPYFDLPSSDVDLARWYKSIV